MGKIDGEIHWFTCGPKDTSKKFQVYWAVANECFIGYKLILWSTLNFLFIILLCWLLYQAKKREQQENKRLKDFSPFKHSSEICSPNQLSHKSPQSRNTLRSHLATTNKSQPLQSQQSS